MELNQYDDESDVTKMKSQLERLILEDKVDFLLPPVGTTFLLEAAPIAGIPVSENPLLPEALYTADEIFTSHSGIKVSPVDRFEDRNLQAPGPITEQLIKLMEDITAFRDDRFKDWFMPLD